MEKLPRTSELIRKSWDMFTEHWKIYIGISLAPMVLFLLIAIGGGAMALVGLALGGLADGEGVKMAGFVLLMLLLVAAIAAAVVVGIWSHVALAVTILEGDTPRIKEAYLRTKHLIRPYFWTSILTGLTVLAGLILLIVPGIIFGLWYSMVSFVVAGEGLRGVAAMKRSKFYVEGYMGQVFARYFMLGLLWLVATIVLQLVLEIVLASDHAAETVVQILSMLVGPVWMIYSSLIYRELKARKTEPSPHLAEAAVPAA